jgi:hypothetical protein
VVRVVTNNYIPFKGTGWYSYSMVNKALAEGLITLADITHRVKPTFQLPADYYVPFIELVRQKTTVEGLKKLMVNMFIGSLGHKISKSRKVFLTDSLNEASYHKFCSVEDDSNRVHVHPSRDIKGLYEVVKVREQYCESSHVPIFNQILDEEAWQMYEIVKLMKKHTSWVIRQNATMNINAPVQFEIMEPQMIYCNTDNIVMEFASLQSVDDCRREAMNVFWDEERQVPKYKAQDDIHNVDRVERDEHGEPLVEKLAAGRVHRPFMGKDLSYQQLYKDTGKMDFVPLAKQLIADGKKGLRCQIQGRAGTGKTTLMKTMLKEIRKDKDSRVLVMCPTHKSCKALDADAKTLHSQWAFMKNSGSDAFTRNNFIFIDEKSLVLEGFWKAILQCIHRLEEKGMTCCIIISGDWDQLPPVCDRSANFDYENSQAIWEISGGRMVKLTECRRMDKSGRELFEMCKDVDTIKLSKFASEEYDRALAYNNSVRRKVNEKWMEQRREGRRYITIPAIDSRRRETQDISVYKGLPLIGIDTCEKWGVVNAEEYRVMSFTAKEIKVAVVLDDDEVDEDTLVSIPVAQFPYLLQPAYCISVHRSQCGTFRRPYTIYQTKKMRAMDKQTGEDLGKRLLYVALSRASDPSFINISNEYD